jgi:peptidoglycan/LPS O-acetylase OafA/YrhL
MTFMDRMKAPDFLKGIAIIGIIMQHAYEGVYGTSADHDLFSFFPGLFTTYFRFDLRSLSSISQSILKLTEMGYQGVHVFVIIAGFLAIYSTNKVAFEPYRYYGRRFSRIYPLYWIALSGVIAFDVLVYGKLAEVHLGGATNMQILGMYLGFYDNSTNAWVLNPALWFITMVIQLFMFFPLLRGLLIRVKDVKFLVLTGALSTIFLYIFMNSSPLAGYFAGCWLFEFAFGMVLANRFEKFEKILSSFKFMIFLVPVYFIGFYLANFAVVWPIGRQLYGVSLTLFLWTLYNLLVKVKSLKIITNAFVFVGVNSYALFLINLPFIHKYFDLVSNYAASWSGPIFGSPYNFMYLPIQSYLIILLSYIVVMLFIAFVLTKTDNFLHRKLYSWGSKQSSMKVSDN